jgi:DedD protein
MASTKSAEISATELELKRRGRRRLIGAITLGLVAVVFLPMVFDSEPRRSGSAMKPQEISVQLPPKEGQAALPAPSAAPQVVIPAPVSAVPNSAPVAAIAEAPKVATPAVEVAKEQPKEVIKEPVKEVTKTASKAEKTAPNADKAEKSDGKAAAAKTGFAVQLGVFGDADNAKHAIAKMKEAKLPVYTESIPIKSGNATRVRVGPYTSREKADAALAQVKLAGTDGKIVPLK